MCVAEAYAAVCCNFCGTMRVGEIVYTISAEDRYRYCSEACITADYEVHQHEVAALSRLTTASAGDVVEPMKLIVRAVARRRHEARGALVPGPDIVCGFRALLDLEAAKSMKDEEMLRSVGKVAARLAIMCKVGNMELSADEATHLLLATQCNAHHIVCPTSGKALALGFFPLTSMLNHSCRPNCAHSFLLQPGRPPQLIMKTIRDVEVGEELVYSYVPLYASTSTRRQALERCYSFTCKCHRCTTESDDDACLDGVLPDTAVQRLLEAIAADTLNLTLSRDEPLASDQREEVSKLLEAVTGALQMGAPAAHRSCFQAYVCLLKSSKHLSSCTELAVVIVLAVVAVGCMNRFCGDIFSDEASNIFEALDALLERFLLLEAGGAKKQETASVGRIDGSRCNKQLACDLVKALVPTLPSSACDLAVFALEEEGEGEDEGGAENAQPLSAVRAASLLRELLSAKRILHSL